ncbi:tyrosine-type recombinase/integrase, partial [Sporichthya brevicatena]|uniref:tyrosine-type recombinase/integrase n=1 Tax=Sporichthya brevicatena TaxID=171442 RepID=UPI0031DB9416
CCHDSHPSWNESLHQTRGDSISGVIARLSGLAGIDPIYAHRLRHTAAMDVLAAGGTLTEARELLGHVYTVTTMTYTKVDLASLRELVVPFGQVPR